MANPFRNKFPIVPILKRASLRHLRIFKDRIKRGVSASGKKFSPYSKQYSEIKARRFERKDGKGRLKSYSQKSIESSQINPPDFTATGLTLRSVKRHKVSERGWYLTFEGQAGDIVEGNKRYGKDIISGVPKKESDFVANYIEKEFMRIYGRPWSEKITITTKLS